jgi:hypothetical protein
MYGGSLSANPMSFVRERMDAAGIDPAIVKIEQSAHSDGEVYGLVVPTQGAQGNHVVRGNSRGIVIHLVDKAKQCFVLLIERGGFEVFEDSPDQFLVFQQFRRNCGVRL